MEDLNGGEGLEGADTLKVNGNNMDKVVDEEMDVEFLEEKKEHLETPNGSMLSTSSATSASSSTAQPTPKRRKIDKQEREAERLKREEEKRVREQERLEKLRVKEEDKRRKEEERIRREEDKKRKDEEKEQERLKREEEKKQRDDEKKRKDEEREEEKKQRDEEKKRKDEEREQDRLKKEEEKRKRDEEKRKKDEERQKRELEKKQAQEKLEENKQKQADFMTKFLKLTPPPRKSTSTTNALSESNSTPTNGENGASDVNPVKTSTNRSSTTPVEVIDLENEDLNPIVVTGKNLLNRFNASFQNDKTKLADCLFKPMPFQVKNGMVLAPIRRRILPLEEKSALDQFFIVGQTNDEDHMDIDEKENIITFLKEIKNRPLRKDERTMAKPSENNLAAAPNNEVEILNEKGEVETPVADVGPVGNARLTDYHFKLLQFHDNRRPAYWGTWQMKPRKVKPRRPFFQEEGVDYEFDSDDEWEDEPEDGEDLNSEKQSDDELGPCKVGEEEDDDEGWMVPHGYLSDDEGGDAEKTGDNVTGAGEVDHKLCDRDSFKTQEEQYYKEIKFVKKLGLPYIQTDNLSAYRMILYKKKEGRRVVKKIPSTKLKIVSLVS